MRSGLLFIFLLSFISVPAQNTTENEYLMLLAGVKAYDQSGGLLPIDTKYTLSAKVIQDLDGVKLECRTVLRSASKELVGTTIKATTGRLYGSPTIYYFALPAANNAKAESFGWTFFLRDIDGTDPAIRKAIILWMAYRTTEALQPKK